MTATRELGRPSGRPRSAEVDDAIASACRELLIEVGYQAMTIEAVAERAGVGRPSVYRRWPSKAHMVWDVIFTVPLDATVIGDTDDLRADLERWVATTVAFFSRPEVARAFPALLIEAPVEQAMQERLRDPIREQLTRRLRRAVREGQLRKDVDIGAIFAMVTGLAIYVGSVPQAVGRRPSVKSVVDQILNGAGGNGA